MGNDKKFTYENESDFWWNTDWFKEWLILANPAQYPKN